MTDILCLPDAKMDAVKRSGAMACLTNRAPLIQSNCFDPVMERVCNGFDYQYENAV
jgi:hypothetical protein